MNLIIKPPGLAAHIEREFAQWLTMVCERLRRARIMDVEFTPLLTENDEIMVRTNDISRALARRVQAILYN